MTTKGGGILLLGATHTLVTRNSVIGNSRQAVQLGRHRRAQRQALTRGSNPNFDTIAFNFAFR